MPPGRRLGLRKSDTRGRLRFWNPYIARRWIDSYLRARRINWRNGVIGQVLLELGPRLVGYFSGTRPARVMSYARKVLIGEFGFRPDPLEC